MLTAKEFAPVWEKVNREWPSKLAPDSLNEEGRELHAELARFPIALVERALLEFKRTSPFRPRLSDWLRSCNQAAADARRSPYQPPPILEGEPMTDADRQQWRDALRAVGVPEKHAEPLPLDRRGR